MEAAFVFVSLFIVIFGIFYLHYSTRNKERLSLIEKGADASIFFSKKPDKKPAPAWKIIIINLAMILIGIGLGLVISVILTNNFEYRHSEPTMVGVVFATTGLCLLAGFFITKKMIDQENK